MTTDDIVRELRVASGIGCARVGDVFFVYYRDTPTVQHVRLAQGWWDRLAPPDDHVVVLLIDANHALPEREAQKAGAAMLARFDARTREVVSYPMGDGFRAVAVRSLMRLVGMWAKRSSVLVDSMEGVGAAIAARSSSRTPPREVWMECVEELIRRTNGSSVDPDVGH